MAKFKIHLVSPFIEGLLCAEPVIEADSTEEAKELLVRQIEGGKAFLDWSPAKNPILGPGTRPIFVYGCEPTW